jgi:hypothetical protein
MGKSYEKYMIDFKCFFMQMTDEDEMVKLRRIMEMDKSINSG